MKNCEPPSSASLELELPDWSGARPLRRPASAERLEQLRQVHAPRQPHGVEHQLSRLRRKQDREFKL